MHDPRTTVDTPDSEVRQSSTLANRSPAGNRKQALSARPIGGLGLRLLQPDHAVTPSPTCRELDLIPAPTPSWDCYLS